MKAHGLSETTLSERISNENKGIEISQPWLSRIVAGKFRRPTRVVRFLADYASIRLFDDGEKDAEGSKLIAQTVAEVWNGSRPHADLIAKLIRIAKGIAPTEQ